VEEEIYERLEKHLGVRFLTEEEGAPSASPDPATPQMFASLPAAWRQEFRKATVEADYARLHALIGEVRSSDSRAADALVALVNGFEYARILALVAAPE
jgi:hypothetical protein